MLLAPASVPDLNTEILSEESSEYGKSTPAALLPSAAGPVPARARRPSSVFAYMAISQRNPSFKRSITRDTAFAGSSDGRFGSTGYFPNLRSRIWRIESESGFPRMRVGILDGDSESDGVPSFSKADIIEALAASEAFVSFILTISHIWRMSIVVRLAFSTDIPLNSEVAVRTMSAPMSFIKANIPATGITVTASPIPKRVVFIEAFI